MEINLRNRVMSKIDTDACSITFTQETQLLNLKDEYLKDFNILKSQLKAIIPSLNNFADEVDKIIKKEDSLDVMEGFIVGVERLILDTGIIKSNANDIENYSKFEDGLLNLLPIVKKVSDIFDISDTNNFVEFHELCKFVHMHGKNIIDEIFPEIKSSKNSEELINKHFLNEDKTDPSWVEQDIEKNIEDKPDAICIGLKDFDLFKKDSILKVSIKKEKPKVFEMRAELKETGKREIQSYRFLKKDWTKKSAIQWVKNRNKSVEISKRVFKKIEQNLIFWGTDEALFGTMQARLIDISKLYNVNRKFVTIEYPEKRITDFLKSNYKVTSVVYEDILENRGRYITFVVQDKNVDAFIFDGQLMIFFDKKEEIEKILGVGLSDDSNQLLNYQPGSYEVINTMYGYELASIENKFNVEPILNDDIIDKLKIDTDTFFKKRKWYQVQNPPLPHKRQILMIGPPGNGKTVIIKNYMDEAQKNRYYVMIDTTNISVDSGFFEYLNKTLSNKEKVLLFEDVDTVASNLGRRSSFLNFLDGVNQLDNTLVIATTNHPERLDKALLNRPSRFDRKYVITYPNDKSREKFLLKYFPKLEKSGILPEYVKLTDGFSGAYFKELFILKNISDISIVEAINLLKEQIKISSSGFFSVEKKKDMPVFKLKGKKKKDERIVLGIVLKPEDVDTYGDIYDGETVVKAADYYMEHFGNVGLMHSIIINRSTKILQSYTTLADMTLTGMDGKQKLIKKDTWIMKFRVNDDRIWKAIKNKELKGLSIGGIANAIELKKIIKQVYECKQ